MDTITYSEARSRFAETLDKVCDDHAPVVITRRNAASVVMMSLARLSRLRGIHLPASQPEKCAPASGVDRRTRIRWGYGAGTCRVKLVFSEHAWGDCLHWQSTDRKRLRRLNHLIQETLRSPYDGIGKPEPLKHGLAGYWPRRIDSEHRVVCKVEGDAVLIAQCRHHY